MCKAVGKGCSGVVDVGARVFDEAVGVKGDHGARWHGDFDSAVDGVRVDAQEEPRREVEDFAAAVGVQQERGRMSCSGEAGTVLGEIELDVQAAGEQARVEFGQETVGSREDFGGGVPAVA